MAKAARAVIKSKADEVFCVREKSAVTRSNSQSGKIEFDRTANMYSPTLTSKAKANFIAGHDLWIAKIDRDIRVITPIVMSGQLLWMDAITGTVYEGNGKAAAHDCQIDLKTVRHDTEAAALMLSKIKGLERK